MASFQKFHVMTQEVLTQHQKSSIIFVKIWFHTSITYYVSNCSNNYGPWQFPEKFILKVICNALQNKDTLFMYINVRDWNFGR